MNHKMLVTLVTVILLLAIALPVGAQTVWQTYGNVRARALDVLGATTLRGATSAAALTATSLQINGNGVVTGTLSATGDLGVATV